MPIFVLARAILSIGVVTGPLIGLQKDPLLLVATVSARRPGALHLAQGLRSGRVRHSDTVGRAEEISPARLMLMNAGAEFQHEELVDAAGETLHGLQIFFRPEREGLDPKVQFIDLGAPDSENAWRWLAGPEDDAPLKVRSRSWIEDGKFSKGTSLALPPLRRPGLTRLLYVFDGAIRMGDLMVESGESVLLTADDRRLNLETTSTLVLFSTNENEPYFRGGMFSGNLMGS